MDSPVGRWPSLIESQPSRESRLERHRAAGYYSSVVIANKMAVFIESRPGLQGGAAVFRGTRVPIQCLFDHLEAGESIEEFLDGFRTVKREQVVGMLEALREEALAAAG